MKCFFCSVICACLILLNINVCVAEENQYHIEEGFLKGSITIDGVEFKLDALFDDDMAMPLREILVAPPSVTAVDVQNQIDVHFPVAKGFKLQDDRAGWFSFSTIEGYYSPEDIHALINYHLLAPTVTNTILNEAVQKCKAFLDALGVSYYDVPTYAVLGKPKDGGGYVDTVDATEENGPYTIRFANAIQGMAIDPAEAGSKRDSMRISQDRVMTNSPYTTFTFTEDGELAYLHLHTFKVVDTYNIDESAISWQEALGKWCVRYNEDPLYYTEYFYEADICVIRIQAVWLTTYNNTLRPGWYFEIQGQDKQTGFSVVNESGISPFAWIGIDAITGDI